MMTAGGSDSSCVGGGTEQIVDCSGTGSMVVRGSGMTT